MSAPKAVVVKCANGLHDMIGDNVRERTGDHDGRRECRECNLDWSRRNYQHRREELNRVQGARVKARALGLLLKRRGQRFTLYDNQSRAFFAGGIGDVETWLDERAVRQPRGPRPTPIPDLWAPWVYLFIEEQSAAMLRSGTVGTRLRHLAALARSLPGSDPRTVTRADLIGYLAGGNRQPRTVHSMRSTFRVFFQTLRLLGHRPDDPTEALPRVRMPRSLPRPCPDQIVLDAYAVKDDPRLALAVRIAVEAGLRRYEIAELRTDQVCGAPGDRALRILGKGGIERTVPVNDELAERITAAAPGFVFPSLDRWGKPTGGHLSSHHLGKLIADALPATWTTHTLRHRFGTVAYQATGDLRAVQDLLGHASPVTTAIHTKVGGDAMRRAAQAATL